MQEEKKVRLLIDEVVGILGVNSTIQEMKNSNSHSDAQSPLEEVEKHYKNTIDNQKVTISMLEADLGRANKQIEQLKEEKKNNPLFKEDFEPMFSTKSEEMMQNKESKDKLSALLLQKTQELQNERQMSETWINELEVTSKAYDAEKKKNKNLLQQVEELNEKVAKLMSDLIKESKFHIQSEEERNKIQLKVSLLEQESKEQMKYRAGIEENTQKQKEIQMTLKQELEEKNKANRELKNLCQKSAAKIEDLKKEIEQEKKLIEEWQSRCLKNENQKNISDQVNVFLNIK